MTRCRRVTRIYDLWMILFGVLLSSAPATADEPVGSALPPSGEDLARQFAGALAGGDAAMSLGVPVPRSPYDNNPFALVRSSTDIAADEHESFVVSPDKKHIAFIVPEGSSFPAIWLARADGGDARELVHLARTPAKSPDGEEGLIPSESLFSLAFSPDAREIYFQTDGWATSLALYAVDVKSGNVRFIVDANGYFVIESCRRTSRTGNIVAYRHSYTELASAVDWYFLLDRTGKQIGALGPAQENVQRFLWSECGPPKPVPVPAKLRSRPGCDGSVLRYEPRRFLDGSVLPRFCWVDENDAFRRFESLDIERRGLPLDIAEAERSLRERCGK
jgi:hypothetical protein